MNNQGPKDDHRTLHNRTVISLTADMHMIVGVLCNMHGSK
jgi:hypothetical protein